MSHPFGELISRHLHRRRGLNQARLADGIDQSEPVISQMCRGQRLTGPHARERVVAMIAWLQETGVLSSRQEAHALLEAAGMTTLSPAQPFERQLLQRLNCDHSPPEESYSPVCSAATPFNTNLPVPLTRFIGRERERATVRQMIAEQRLVTLTGAGGVGKTRLALEVARELTDSFPDGIWLVELAPVADSRQIAPIFATALNIRTYAEPASPETLAAALRAKRLLLILDNCEHLLDACAALANTLLQACPQLHLLVTSREALGLLGEHLYAVPSMALPEIYQTHTLDRLHQSDAVRLFLDRASMLVNDFHLTAENAPAIVQTLMRLDGIPLAIELAASRLKSLSVEQIAARLDDQFHLLTRGSRAALPRHQTLRACMDWSHILLSQVEQILFRRLAIFVGGWTLEAAERVCSGDGIAEQEIFDILDRLVSKSLVVMMELKRVPRYRMLEPVRQYAEERLEEAGELGLIRARHLTYFVEMAEMAEAQLAKTRMSTWIHYLQMEYDNIRMARAWAQENDTRAGTIVQFAR